MADQFIVESYQIPHGQEFPNSLGRKAKQLCTDMYDEVVDRLDKRSQNYDKPYYTPENLGEEAKNDDNSVLHS